MTQHWMELRNGVSHMQGRKAWIGGMGFWAVCVLGSGCVSQGEFNRVEFARRNAEQRSTELEREVADARSQRQIIEEERNSVNRELNTKTLLYENTLAENKRLEETLRKTQGFADEALKATLKEPQVIEITKLPPELDRALKEFAGRYPDSIEYLQEQGAVRWKSDLTFSLGSDVVKDQAQSALRDFGEIVNSTGSEFELVIVGHTDNVPIKHSNREHKSNWHLSTHRAIAVGRVLNQFGVPNEKMGCMGYGEFRPREVNPPTGGNEKNRRVEIFLVSARDSFAGGASAAARTGNLDELAGRPRTENESPRSAP